MAVAKSEPVDGIAEVKKEEEKSQKKPSVKDFDKLAFLGEGSYARVLEVKHKETGKIYAMKAILKSHMQKATLRY